MTATWLGLALATGLGLLEWRRPDPAHRLLRLALVLVAAGSLTWLARLAITPAPAEPITAAAGPLAVDAPADVPLGAVVPVRGRATIAAGDSAWVVLADPSGPVDSAPVTAAAPAFRLEAPTRAAGGLLLTVTLRGAAAVVESLGVAVIAAPPPALLLLDGSPSFETTFLKRWLAARGGRMLIRATLTRDRARVERVNDPDTGPVSLTPATLARYDAVLADAGALAALTAAERRALADAITTNGLGLLLTAGTPEAAGLTALGAFHLVPGPPLEQRLGHPVWPGAPRGDRTGIPLLPATLRAGAGLTPLVRDEAGGWLAAVRGDGAGVVAVTLVLAPSRWMLEGDAARYGGYWSRLLGAVARDTATAIRLEGPPPRTGERLDLTFVGGGPGLDASVRAPDGSTTPLALARDPYDPRLRHGTTWPRETGWHTLRLGVRQVPFFVAGARPEAPTPPAPRQAAEGSAAFLLFLVAASLLWAESRRQVGR